MRSSQRASKGSPVECRPVGRTCALFTLLLILNGCSEKSATLPIDKLTINVPERVLMNSPATFKFAEHGHFGDKVQYDGCVADEYGGAYAVHLRGGKIFGIEVKFAKPIPREKGILLLERLIGEKGLRVTEHDDTDLRLKDTKQPYEVAYFNNGIQAEAYYTGGDAPVLTQLNVFRR